MKKKKFKDVQPGDILYKLNKRYISEGISEVVVRGVESQDDGELTINIGDYEECLCIPKTTKAKTVHPMYDSSVYATSREELLKATEKYIKKTLEKIDGAISDTKDRLDCLIEDRKKIYKLFLDASFEVINNK